MTLYEFVCSFMKQSVEINFFFEIPRFGINWLWACVGFFMHSIRLPIESLSAMCFSSLLISEMLSSDPCLYVFVMLSCKSLLYV